MSVVLLTGGTGLIGGAVLHDALNRPGDDRWIALVRGSNVEQARARLLARMQRFCPPDEAARLLARVEIVPGDFTQLTMDAHPALADVTHVLHLAADTSWWGDEKVTRTNLHGTLAFASRVSRLPRLERFLHVSTAMICGADSDPYVREEDFPSADARHLVSYSRSKSAAEVALLRGLPDLPLVIARPSIVVGHSTLGARPSSSILWVFMAGDRLRLIGCDLAGSIDVVPSDWTASTLIELLHRPALAHQTYHLSAGLPGRSDWSELGRVFEREDPAGGKRDYRRLLPGERAVLRQRFRDTFGLDTPQKVAMMRAIQAYFQFCELSLTFSNERLLAEGFAPPPRFADYLPRCIDPEADVVSLFADDAEMFCSGLQVVRGSRRRLPERARSPLASSAAGA